MPGRVSHAHRIGSAGAYRSVCSRLWGRGILELDGIQPFPNTLDAEFSQDLEG
jgi:hypothetical protein